MNRMEFGASGRIIFGNGTIAELPKIAATLGRTILLVTGKGGDRYASIASCLEESGHTVYRNQVEGEPALVNIEQGVMFARSHHCDLVIGLGGGSVMDTAKAIAALAPNPGDVLDYLEVVGSGKPLEQLPLNWIAVPTTAGTGSEVTRNAVISIPQHRVKVSLRSSEMVAKVALIDPELTRTVPPAITATSGMDALTQVIEPFVSLKANPVTDEFCKQGIARASWALRRAFQDGKDLSAREAMCLTSLMGGLALANAGLGVVHGFAGPIGGMFEASHGAICAALLAAGMRANIQALQCSTADLDVLKRYQWIAGALTGDPGAEPLEGVSWVEKITKDLQIPKLAAYGIKPEDFQEIIDRTYAASSMKANPVRLSNQEMMNVLEEAL